MVSTLPVWSLSGCRSERLFFPVPLRYHWVIKFGVLGPLLFLLYVIDSLSGIRHGTPSLFANDLRMACSFETSPLKLPLELLNKDLKPRGNRCSRWFMVPLIDDGLPVEHKCHAEKQPLKLQINSRV